MKVTWITVVIQELIHAKSVALWAARFYQTKTNHLRVFIVVSLDKLADRMVSNRRWIIQVSDLSTFDGSVLVYHGCNG